MLRSLMRPAQVIDSAQIRVALGPIRASGDWERRRLETVKTRPRVSEMTKTRVLPVSLPLEDSETAVEWLGVKVTREEVATLPWADLFRKLVAP